MKRLVLLLTTALFLTVAPVVGFSQDIDVDANTVLLFRFEEIQGDNTVTDYSGNNHNGEINGSLQVVPGRWGNAYAFDGQSHILVRRTDMLDIKQNLTVEFWIKCQESVEGEQFVLNKRGGSPRSGWEMYILTGNFMNILAQTLPSELRVSVDTQPGIIMQVDEWRYCAVTYDGVDVKLYVDGELINEAPQDGDLGIEADFYIGAEKGSSGFFKGALDSLRISNVARTADEIKESVTAVELGDKLANIWGRMKTRY